MQTGVPESRGQSHTQQRLPDLGDFTAVLARLLLLLATGINS